MFKEKALIPKFMNLQAAWNCISVCINVPFHLYGGIFCRFFSYSLEDRIIPRHKLMVENQVNFKLRFMLNCSDEEFHQKVADKVERRRRFEAGLLNEDLIDSEVTIASSVNEEIVSSQ